MVERKRLTAEQYSKQTEAVKKIAELTEKIKALLPEFEGQSVHAAYENSVKNLEKKNEIYGKERTIVTDEDKEILRKIRAGEVTLTPVEKKENEVSASGDNDGEPTHAGKKGKRNN